MPQRHTPYVDEADAVRGPVSPLGVMQTGGRMTRAQRTSGPPARRTSLTSSPASWRWVVVAGVAVVPLLVLAAARGSSGLDLQAYLDAGHRLLDQEPLYQAVTQSGPFQPGQPGLYLYPPPLAVASVALAMLEPSVAVDAWLVLHVAALVVACWAMPVRPGVRAAAFVVGALMYPVLNDSVLGNVSVFAACLAALAWRGSGAIGGGVALAIGSVIRPTLGLMLVPWVVRRRWRPVVGTGAALMVLVVATIPVVGVDGWLDYLRLVRNLGDGLGVPGNVSLAAVAVAAGVPREWAPLLQLTSYATAGIAVLVATRRDVGVSMVVAAAASMLAAPLLWGHYVVLALLPAALLAHRGRPWFLVLLAPLSWLPVLAGSLAFVYPGIAFAATLLPLLRSRGPASAADRAVPTPDGWSQPRPSRDAGARRDGGTGSGPGPTAPGAPT